ncbi:MAG TPA: hypothetical protein VII22_23765 [Streptosporangiaceae bacterium]
MVYDDARESEVTSLEKLASELTARGFETRLAVPQGHVPSLAITNPQATALSETVIVGEDWYWWSWGEKVAPVAEVSEAAGVIARVLSAGSSST